MLPVYLVASNCCLHKRCDKCCFEHAAGRLLQLLPLGGLLFSIQCCNKAGVAAAGARCQLRKRKCKAFPGRLLQGQATAGRQPAHISGWGIISNPDTARCKLHSKFRAHMLCYAILCCTIASGVHYAHQSQTCPYLIAFATTLDLLPLLLQYGTSTNRTAALADVAEYSLSPRVHHPVLPLRP